MNHALRFACLSLFALSSLSPAQNEGGKPADKPKADPKTPAADAKEPQSPKDDLAMAKDPAIIGLDKFVAKTSIDKKNPQWRERLTQPPLQAFDPNTEYFWNMDTSKGLLVIKLFHDTAPIHVTSGMYLSRIGYFDGLKFHRVIKGFMAQGGCPKGSGTGGPGYQFDGEFFGTRKHDKPGILSMANAGPKTDGSQFFLTFRETPHLDGRHTIWGEVVEGLDTLKALEAAGTEQDGVKLAEPPMIVKTWITIKKAAPKPKDKAAAPADKKPEEPKK